MPIKTPNNLEQFKYEKKAAKNSDGYDCYTLFSRTKDEEWSSTNINIFIPVGKNIEDLDLEITDFFKRDNGERVVGINTHNNFGFSLYVDKLEEAKIKLDKQSLFTIQNNVRLHIKKFSLANNRPSPFICPVEESAIPYKKSLVDLYIDNISINNSDSATLYINKNLYNEPSKALQSLQIYSVIGGEYLISSPFKNVNFSDVTMSSTDGYGVWAEFVNTHSKECGDIKITETYLEYTKDRNANSNSNDIVINAPSFEINNGIFDMTHEGDGFPCRRILQCSSPINIKNQTIFLYGTLAVTCNEGLNISGNKDIEPYGENSSFLKVDKSVNVIESGGSVNLNGKNVLHVANIESLGSITLDEAFLDNVKISNETSDDFLIKRVEIDDSNIKDPKESVGGKVFLSSIAASGVILKNPTFSCSDPTDESGKRFVFKNRNRRSPIVIDNSFFEVDQKSKISIDFDPREKTGMKIINSNFSGQSDLLLEIVENVNNSVFKNVVGIIKGVPNINSCELSDAVCLDWIEDGITGSVLKNVKATNVTAMSNNVITDFVGWNKPFSSKDQAILESEHQKLDIL